MRKLTSHRPKKLSPAKIGLMLGISRQAAHKHLKSGKAPQTDDPAEWESYLAQVGREGSAPTEVRKAIGQQRLRILKASAEKIERENSAALERIVSRDDVAFALAKGMAELFSALDRSFSITMPPVLKGLDEASIQSRLLEEVKVFKSRLSESLHKLARNGDGK